jgi:TRAP-type C4-dicarboxylate transport system permease small subunit
MKLWVRIAIFTIGAAILFFSWHKAHNQMVNLQTPSSGGSVGSAEVLVVIGGFVMLMAFAPSQEALGRWMALKKPKKARAAHFKRRR